MRSPDLSRAKLAAAATIVALGGLTAVAVRAGNSASSEPGPAPKAAVTPPTVVRTVIVRRTIPTKAEKRRAARAKAARRRAIRRHRRAIAAHEAAIAHLLGRGTARERRAARHRRARRGAAGSGR